MTQQLETVFSVSELTDRIKGLLEPKFRSVSVRGEISNFKLQSSGHLYFSLKDEGSQLSCALFRGNAAQLERMPKDGDQVIASGSISLYAPRGQYQIIIRNLQFLGVGELLLKFHQLKKVLEARGWFDPAQKKALPKFPKRIGVITSPTGAVIRDILHVLERRFSGFQLLLNPVKVQGDGAAEEIAQAIKDFNRYQLCDLLIVGRGGGSIEDLWAFNEEKVAEAIHDSEIPIISAVGHETDFTLADWVADIRAPTPSAAAELATREKANMIQFLEDTRNQMLLRLRQQILHLKKHLGTIQRHPLISSPYNILAPALQRLDDFSRRLEMSSPLHQIKERRTKITDCQNQMFLRLTQQVQYLKKHLSTMEKHPVLTSPYGVLDPVKQKLSDFSKRLDMSSPLHQIKEYQNKIQRSKDYLEALSPKEMVIKYRDRLKRVQEHLRSINPKNLLKKGYAILFNENKQSIILSSTNLAPKQKIIAQMHDGRIEATIDKVEKHDS